ncbi:MAG TPA: histidine--tRNA ligase [Puia sp.]|jgi:histidyl-tRNA synthetase|nr:histidine--tRNA ligase [Puia sp.]
MSNNQSSLPRGAKPSLPQGTRDFGPDTVRKRKYILDTIRTIFELYGYQPLETPAMEQLDTLMGKYGEEGDKLIFKILNNGLNDPKNIDKARAAFEKVVEGKNDKDLTERALRYDLTIPFARYVAMNHGQLHFPFKRYQIQPVWRADRPQKGRYREFYQCDADVVGSYSLINEVELAAIYQTAFKKLGIPIEIKVNNRKILAALAEICGGAAKLTDITIAIDKLDKIGLDKVKAELTERGLDPRQIATIEQYLGIDGDNSQKLAALKAIFAENQTGLQGIADLEYILEYYPAALTSPLTANMLPTVDPTLARGLNYYTGTIFEVKAMGVQMGSIGGGGRYDDLTGTFGVPGIPGVGISFGVDRIYDVMEELQLFPADVHTGTKVLFFNLGEDESREAFKLMQQLRDRGIPAELYHEQAKFDRQFKYAEKKGIRYVAIIGGEEVATKTVKFKDLRDGSQRSLTFQDLTRPDLFR